MNTLTNTKKRLYLAAAVLLSASLLAGCGKSGRTPSPIDYSNVQIRMESSPDAVRNLVILSDSNKEISSENLYLTPMLEDSQFLSNLYDPLVSLDENGNPTPALATSWESDPSATTWTVHLRTDACWVDVEGKKQADLTSADCVTALEWMLNYWKCGDSAPLDIVGMLEGAEEYREYTRTLSKDDAWSLTSESFQSIVGIETPDPYTVVFRCNGSCPYFVLLLTSTAFYPAPTELIAKIGVDKYYVNYYLDAWFSGPYIMTEFIRGNEKILEPNPLWYGNEENTRFQSVTIKMVDDYGIAFSLYERDEINSASLSKSKLNSILSNPDSPYYSRLQQVSVKNCAFQLFFNFDKLNKDGTRDEQWNRAAANENFRKSLYYGLNTSNFLSSVNPVSPYECQSYCLVNYGFCQTSDGTDYVDLVRNRLGLTGSGETGLVRLDSSLAEQYKREAIRELTAEGVTFPIEIDFYVDSADQTKYEYGLFLKKDLETSFGTDYVRLNIKSYYSSPLKDVAIPQVASIILSGWVPACGDPRSSVKQVTLDEEAFASSYYTNIVKLPQNAPELRSYQKDLLLQYHIFTDMVEKADAVLDLDERYEAFADAEAYYYEHVLGSIPVYYKINTVVSDIDQSSIPSLVYSALGGRYLNYVTNRNGY